MNIKILKSLSNEEVIRIIDLAMRRMVDNGLADYCGKDRNLFDKMQKIKIEFGKKYGGML